MNQLVSSLWVFPPGRYGVVYIAKSPLLPLDVASSLSSGGGYLFEGFWSIWVKIAQPLVVNFVVFRREVELQSFYSATLIPSPGNFKLYMSLTFYFNCFFPLDVIAFLLAGN